MAGQNEKSGELVFRRKGVREREREKGLTKLFNILFCYA
jgi:hypothetical protein